MKAAIYCRVSTSGQEDNYSLPTQEQACRSLAAEKGGTVVGVYRDVHSGYELWERPQLTALREATRSGEVDAIIVYDPDRLSRRQIHFAVLVDECERYSVALLFVNGQHDKTAVGEFLANARAFAAELEREKLRERSQRGMLARMKGGKLRPSNRPLYGYAWADETKGAYIIDEEKAVVVKRIFAAVADGKTLRAIAHMLNDEGVPTANGGKHWSHVVIRSMLKHAGYAGTAICNRYVDTRIDGKRKRTDRPESDHVALPTGTIPPIVSPELFAVAQTRLARNKAEATRNNRNPEAFLLRAGFVRCGYCGRAVSAVWNSNRAGAEPAPLYTVAHRSCDHYDCPSFTIKATILDDAVWQKVVTILTRPEIIATEVERLRRENPVGPDLTTVARAISEIKRRQANLGRSLAQIDDAYAAAPLIVELQSLGGRQRELESEQEALQIRQAGWLASQERLTSIEAWASAVARNIECLAYAEKRDLLTALDVTVKLYRADHTPRYEITASLPLDNPDIVVSPPSARSICIRRGRRR